VAFDFNVDKNSVVVLYKGGRLPSWEQLAVIEQEAVSREHVDLMLEVAREHGLQRLEGFKLVGPHKSWQRFWLIEFPTMQGAEAWIEAEMAPPYGFYGYYEYFLSRRCGTEYFNSWVHQPVPPPVPRAADPHEIPQLWEDRSGVTLLLFGRWRPGAEGLDPELRGDAEHEALMRQVAREQGLGRLEVFQLIDRQSPWHRVLVMEFPTFEAAEIFIDAEVKPPHGLYSEKSFYLARKWSPEYFASWVSPATSGAVG
jgi:hypothetical protein